MKKIISVVLAITFVFSALFSIPISVGAETASSTVVDYFENPDYYTHVDFSEEFYASNTGDGTYNSYNYAEIVEDPDTASGQGKAAKFNKISQSYYAGAALNNNNRKYPNVVRIADLSGKTAFKVVEGETYKVQWSLKKPVTQGSAFNVGFFITNDYDLNFFNAEELADTETRYEYYVSATTTTYWANWYAVEFTAAKSGTLAMMISKSGGKVDGVEVYVDDIAVSRVVNYTHVDFNEDYYAAQTGDGTYSSYNYATIAEDPADASNKAAKFTTIAQTLPADTEAADKHKWPNIVRIADLSGKTAFKVVEGKDYTVSWHLKKPVTQGVAFNAGVYITNDTDLNLSSTDKLNEAVLQAEYYVSEAAVDYWQDWYTVTFTASKSGTLAMMLKRSSKVDNVEVYIDNITVGETTSVTCHNNNGSADTVASVSTGTAFDKITAPTLAGAEFKGWYLDETLTVPAVGYVAGTKEIWAKWASVAENFDTVDSLSESMVRDQWGDSFSLTPNMGYGNTTAVSTSVEKYNWHPALQLYNADGSEFKTVSGHSYQLTFKYLAEDPSALTDNSYIGINYVQSDNSTSVTTNAYAYKSVKYSYYSGDTQINSGWITYNIEFTGQDNLGVWLKFHGMTTTAYIDDVQIVDLTAQKKITTADGTVLASGYIGDSAELIETDVNGDTNRIYWSETENGAEYIGNDIILDNVTLYPVYSQIAVTNTTITGGEKAKLNTKIRFEALGLTATENGVSVDSITVNGTRYIVKEIGVIVAPTAALNGENLTLDNYAAAGGQLVKNSDVKYSIAADGVLTVVPQIAVADVNTDYTVVAYVQYAINNRIIYSETRSGLDTTYAGAADLDAVESYTATPSATTYTLVENSEFNDNNVNVFDKWGNWGGTTESNGVTTYASASSVSVNDGYLTLNTVKNSDTSISNADILSNHLFTHGYIEVSAKFADLDDISGAIWLNSAGIDESLLNVKPTETDTYVKPEIDIVEFASKSSEYITLHSWPIGATTSSKMTRITVAEYLKNNSFTITDSNAIELDLTQTHIYGFERTSDAMRFYIDGVLAFEVTKEQLEPGLIFDVDNRTAVEVQALFDNPTYLRIGTSFAPDGKDVGTTATSYIDYVRIYE